MEPAEDWRRTRVDNQSTDLDRTSFHLGMINCFAEMVAVGVKPLAISPPLLPGEYDAIKDASETIVRGSGIHSYLEKSLLVTHLQSADFTRGRWSILYYKDEKVLEAYLALKERKATLESQEESSPIAFTEISREFMTLLGYPEKVIEGKIGGGGEEDPFVLE
jgi:hypothetical protein